jgi:hypothetical protein
MLAEEERFELSVGITSYAELATQSFKPLTHSSSPFAIMEELMRLSSSDKII